MNRADRYPQYKNMYAVVKNLFDGTDFAHGPLDETYYTLRVFETAKKLCKRVKGCDERAILVAAIFHDTGKVKLDPKKLFVKSRKKSRDEWHRHPLLSVSIARHALKKLKHSKEFIDKVCYLVRWHDERALKEKTLDLKVLQDADLLADSGMAGFIRPFAYSGKFKHQSLIGAIQFHIENKNRVAENGMLNLAITKKMARKKHALERKLISIIAKDIESELLR